jgi:hypothetical protein
MVLRLRRRPRRDVEIADHLGARRLSTSFGDVRRDGERCAPELRRDDQLLTWSSSTQRVDVGA